MNNKMDPLMSIGAVARRVGCAVSAVRFYADQGFVPSVRASSGHRMFRRSVIRRISFILISQKLGYSLADIRSAIDTLPSSRTPTKGDWELLSQQFVKDIDRRVDELEQLKAKLTGCIGCGCLSLSNCHLYNPEDGVSKKRKGADLFFKGINQD
ncbi:redox-sensitive transcriptional activator SoxR [Arenicella sp. 4NH20-0111]|uniref:redox-sensitive transcriptional activator SoxR n=1 Tax=Arenicella sp. 4NH20-0111 TaxID=3127648 RepID=UPI003109B5F1